MKTDRRKNNQGRKKLEEGDKKEPVAIYVKAKHISMLNGIEKVRAIMRQAVAAEAEAAEHFESTKHHVGNGPDFVNNF